MSLKESTRHQQRFIEGIFSKNMSPIVIHHVQNSAFRIPNPLFVHVKVISLLFIQNSTEGIVTRILIKNDRFLYSIKAYSSRGSWSKIFRNFNGVHSFDEINKQLQANNKVFLISLSFFLSKVQKFCFCAPI